MLSEFGIFAGIVVNGYLVLAFSNINKPRLQTISNYALLFESAIFGAILFGTSWLCLVILKISLFEDCSLKQVVITNSCWFLSKHPFLQFDALSLSVFLGMLTLAVGNYFNDTNKTQTKVARRSSKMSAFILDAIDDLQLVQITTIRNLVYVGWIQEGPGMSLSGSIEDIAVVPLYVGHRDNQNQQVRLVTKFSRSLMRLVPTTTETGTSAVNQKLHEKSVIVPIREIALIERFGEA